MRIGGIREGVLFLPFHYGYWDTEDPAGDKGERAANEPTVTDWDPVCCCWPTCADCIGMPRAFRWTGSCSRRERRR